MINEQAIKEYVDNIERDCSYFLGKNALSILLKHEQQGTLVEFLSEVAPDYVLNGQVEVFHLINDLGLYENFNEDV